MRRFLYALLMATVIVACSDGKKTTTTEHIFSDEKEQPADSTLYGQCGYGSNDHCLLLVTGLDDTLSIVVNDEESMEPTVVAGGLMAGDRMAVTACRQNDELVAQRIINLTSLQGRWKSLDRGVELTEDGEVNTLDDCENPRRWTSWRILNGRLLLSRDTFDVVAIDVDTMLVEDNIGLYSYLRIRQDTTHAATGDQKILERKK